MALTYSITGGADAAKFSIGPSDGKLSFKTAPDFEAPGDADHNNVYVVEVGVSDGTTTTKQTINVTVTDVPDTNLPPQITSPATKTVNENTLDVMTVTATDPDGGGTPPVEPPPTTTGFPDASNTGCSGTLTPSGGVTSTAVNQVIQNLNSTGQIRVVHSGVRVKNCKARTVKVESNCPNVIIEDCELYGGINSNSWYSVVTFSGGCQGGKLLRCDITKGENGIEVTSTGITIQDNYVHDLEWDDGSPHYDLIQMTTGAAHDIVVDHNTFAGDADDSADITMTTCRNFVITNNLFKGAAIQLRIEGSGSTGGRVEGNTFEKSYVYDYVRNEAGTPFANNTFDGVLRATGHP